MSDQFDSPRQAIAYHFSCLGGPAMAQLRAGAPVSTGHGAWDGPIIGAMLYGPNPGRIDPTTGAWGEGCGLKPGSELELELAEWAFGYGVALSARGRDIVGRLKALMEQHGVKPKSEPARASDVRRFTDDEGRTFARLRR